MFVFKAAVVGAGTVGGEIAYVIASADIPVVLQDADQRHLDAGIERARSIWQRLVDAGRITAEEMERQAGLISATTAYDRFGDVDFVVEAGPEVLDVKQRIFADLDAVTPGHAILATTASALSITEIAFATTRPDRVVGFHFFSPASTVRLVEVVEGVETAPETIQTALAFAGALRKQAIRCDEGPGFVVNRVLVSALGEVFRSQAATEIDVAAIDAAITEARAMRKGPFALADQFGLDTIAAVNDSLNETYGDRVPRVAALAERIDRGDLGAKSGKGFYDHGA